MHSKPWIMVLSWEDSIIISRDNPVIKSLSKFGSRRLSHQSPFFPRLSPIIFSQKALVFRRFSELPKFFFALQQHYQAAEVHLRQVFLQSNFGCFCRKLRFIPLVCRQQKSGLRLYCCKTTFGFNNYLFGTFEKLSYFCIGF